MQIAVADFSFLFRSSKDLWDEAAVIANFLLVLVGIGGTLVAISTLRKLERQTKATEESARSSAEQASHFGTMERPFLIVEGIRTGENFEFRAVNCGRSPAKIVFGGHIEPLSLGAEDNFPDKPFYGAHYDNDAAEEINTQWLAPGKDMHLGEFSLSYIKDGSPQLYDDLSNGRKRFYLYSVVKYRGLIPGKIYRSKYCYLAINGGIRMSGPPGYNEYE